MARFAFGKNRKRLSEASQSFDTSDDYERHDEEVVVEEHTLEIHNHQKSQQTTTATSTSKVTATAPPISAGGTPWRRHKLYNSPFPRYRHAASAIASDKNEIFLMGGLKEGSVFGDTWKITPQSVSSTSSEVAGYEATTVEVANQNNPPARVGHASVLCGNAFIIFGGDTVDTDFNGYPDNNFYLFNINNNKYTIPSHVLNKPNGRYGHSLGVVSLNNSSSKLYLFGGQLEDEVFSDLYYFELNTFKSPKARWELVEPANNFKPPPLTNHSMSVFKHKLYVFGGVYNNEKVSNDLWCYDALATKWTQLTTTGSIPPPVNEHSSCIVGDKLFIYGGNDFSGIIYDFLYVLDLHSLVWSKLSDEASADSPGPRCGHTMTYLSKFNKLLIMGGDKNDYVSGEDHDFNVYEDINGEPYGTMIYELDVNVVDYFLSATPTSRPSARKLAVAAAASANTANNDSKGSLHRHARSISAGPDDFKTPDASPETAARNAHLQVQKGAQAGSQTEAQAGAQSGTQSGVQLDKFVDVDLPSGTISERDTSIDETKSYSVSPNLEPSSPELVASSKGVNKSLNGHSSEPDHYDFNESAEDLRQNNSNTPVLTGGSGVGGASVTGAGVAGAIGGASAIGGAGLGRHILSTSSNGKNKQALNEYKLQVRKLSSELQALKESTDTEIQFARQKIQDLEDENSALRDTNRVEELETLLAERDSLITDLKAQVDPAALQIDEERGIDGEDSVENTRGLSELSRYKLERLELKNKLVYLERENAALTTKFETFEPFMNNQIGELADLQKVIKVQEEKIAKLSGDVKDQEQLHKEIFDWKHKYESLELEYNNFKTINGDDVISEHGDVTLEDEEGGAGDTTRSLISTSTGGRRSKKDISNHLENLVSLWTAKSVAAKSINAEIKPEEKEMVGQLQKQLDDLIEITKQQEIGSSSEIQSLKQELNLKLQSLKTFEENYRDALQSVNNTSKALNLTQDELNSQKMLMDKLVKENRELKLFKKASKRSSSRSPLISETELAGATLDPGSPTHDFNFDEDDHVIANAHYNMKLKDLEADLYILKQERDQLKENVTSLQKELYLAKLDKD